MKAMKLWMKPILQHLQVGVFLAPAINIDSEPTNKIPSPVLPMSAMHECSNAWIDQTLSILYSSRIWSDESVGEVADNILVPFGLDTLHVDHHPRIFGGLLTILGFEVELDSPSDPDAFQVLPVLSVLRLP